MPLHHNANEQTIFAVSFAVPPYFFFFFGGSSENRDSGSSCGKCRLFRFPLTPQKINNPNNSGADKHGTTSMGSNCTASAATVA